MKSLAVMSPLKRLPIPVWPCLRLALYTGVVAAVVVAPLLYAQDMPTAEEMQEMMQGMQQMREEMEKLDPLDHEHAWCRQDRQPLQCHRDRF